MHRDHFIRIVTNTEQLITSLLLQEMKIDIKKYNIRTLKKPIGEVDVEIKVYFTKEGMQISFIIPNQERFNQTFTWEEYFKTY